MTFSDRLSGAKPEPAVYITDRNTDLPIVSRLGPWVFSDTIQTVRPSIIRDGPSTTIHIKYLDQQSLFTAEVSRSTPSDSFVSQIFASPEEFTNFMKLGVSSYTPSIFGDCLTKVDMRKEERPYEPLDAIVDLDALDGVWREAGIVFDSAVRASGGRYKWIYRGLAPTLLSDESAQQDRFSVPKIRSLRRVTT